MAENLNVNIGLPVKGYGFQADEKVAVVNENKVLEERVLRQIERIRDSGMGDPRMIQLAFDGIQASMMWLNRAVFQPSRIALPEAGA